MIVFVSRIIWSLNIIILLGNIGIITHNNEIVCNKCKYYVFNELTYWFPFI